MVDRILQAEFLESRNLDLVADYLRRGRKHENLTGELLRAEWVSNYRHMADDPAAREWHHADSDLRAEFQLRGEMPPFALVEEETRDFAENLGARLREMKKDPDKIEAFYDDLEEDLAAFKASKSRGN